MLLTEPSDGEACKIDTQLMRLNEAADQVDNEALGLQH